MKVLIIYHSEHHQNTEKIARAMAAKIGADLKEAREVRAEDINNYEIIISSPKVQGYQEMS